MSTGPSETTQLFELNLLGAQAKSLDRRRAFQKVSVVASLALVAVGGVVAILGAYHYLQANMVAVANHGLEKELADAQAQCFDMDSFKMRANARLAPFTPLSHAATRRIAWYPKLAAMAHELKPGMGVMSLKAADPAIFDKDGAPVNPAAQSAPQLDFALLYAPSGKEDPLLLLERLRANPQFMNKMTYLRLEATEESVWNMTPVIVLRCSARGEEGQ